MTKKSKKTETEKRSPKHETHQQGEERHDADGGMHDKGDNKGQDAVARELEEKITEYQVKLESLQKSLDETNDKFLRLFSEFDNYRKRMTRERIELSKTASEEIITALLPVLDDLERAAESTRETGGDNQAGKEGIVLIYNKFKNILQQKGVEEIPTVGSGFSTDYHEAITHIPANDKDQKGKVVETVQKGYLLNGKVIRFARVVVAN